jgi:phage shock protein PspC (stress-responsive transcriptional regulator)
MSSQDTTTTPPPMPSNIRRLTRRRDNKMLAGVCSGLGDYTGLDPILFRIIFVALAFAGGSGLLLYALAWIFVPETGAHTTRANDLLGRFEPAPWLGIALLIIGGCLLLGQVGLFSGPIRWGIALLVLGFVLFRDHDSHPDRGARPPEPPSPAYSPAYSPGSRVAGADASTTAILPPTQPPAEPAAVAAPRPPRERSALGWYTIAATLLALGVAALLDASNVLSLTLVQYLALPLAVIGIGLIVGAWLGRSRLLILLGILLIPFVLAASLIHVPLTGNAGTFIYRPQSAADVPGTYHIAAGDLTLDLRRFALTPGINNFTATVGAGQVRVVVPPKVPVRIDGRTGLGNVNVFGRDHAGAGVHFQKVANASGSSPTLSLHVEAGLGEVRIERVRNGIPAALLGPPASSAPSQR